MTGTGLATFGLSGLSGCVGGSGGGGGGSMTFEHASLGGDAGDWFEESYVTPWEEDTGHTINMRPMEEGPIESNLIANKDDPELDLVHVGNQFALKLGARDLVAEVGPDVLDNWDDVTPLAKHNYMVGQIYSPVGIAVDPDARDELGGITSWRDFLHPRFEGRVGINSWSFNGSVYLYMLNAALGGDDLSDPQTGLDFIQEVAETQDPYIIENSPQQMDLWGNDQIDISIWQPARTVLVGKQYGRTVDWTVPDEPVMASFWGECPVAGIGEDRLDAMYDFVDSTLIAERQAGYSANFGYPPSNPDAVELIDDEVLEETPSIQLQNYVEIDDLSTVDINWPETSQYSEEHQRRYDQALRA